MVKIDLFYQDDDNLKSICIYDHANYDIKGHDLVCAGISSIAFGMANSFNELCLDAVSINIDEKNTKIVFEKLVNHEVVDILFKALLIQLLTISNQYSEYIKIRRFKQ